MGGQFMMYDDANGKYPIIARQQRDFDGMHGRLDCEGCVYQQRR